MMKNLFDKIKIALFTKRCKICGEVVCFDEDLCDDCISLPEIINPRCVKCGCSKVDCVCRKHKKETEYKEIIAPFYYENSVRKGILNFKSNGMKNLADFYGKSISDTVKEHYQNVKFDCVAYVPMQQKDVSKRGFNQSELLAQIVSDKCGIPLNKLLYKKRKTKLQKYQSLDDRFSNVYNAFDLVEGADVSGRTILLIDDIKTSGATLSSASAVLKAYGAKAVYCATIAIVRRKIK